MTGSVRQPARSLAIDINQLGSFVHWTVGVALLLLLPPGRREEAATVAGRETDGPHLAALGRLGTRILRGNQPGPRQQRRPSAVVTDLLLPFLGPVRVHKGAAVLVHAGRWRNGYLTRDWIAVSASV
jgi:hypothetical protein